MNPYNNLNSSENIHHQPPQTSNHHEEQPIDAEIIAETPNNSSEIDEIDENTISLTYYPVLEEAQEPQHPSHDGLPLWLQQILTPLCTPWGVGSLSLILGTNLAVAGVQWWKIYSTEQPPESANLTVAPSPSSLSIPKSLNIARQSPDKVTLDSLSTVPNPSPSSQSPQTVASKSPSTPTPKETVVNVNQPLTLTNAILPPSLQPKTPSHYGLSTTPLKVPQAPKTTASIPVANIPRPSPASIKPSTVPSMIIDPPPPPVNNQPVSQDEQVRQAIKQQLKMEENNQGNIPLGFNHKTRLELQNGMNEVPPELLPQQVKHLEQLQQREVLDSESSPSIKIE